MADLMKTVSWATLSNVGQCETTSPTIIKTCVYKEMQCQRDITHVDISFENIMLAWLRVWLLHSVMVITSVRNDSPLNACNHIQNTGVMAVVLSVMMLTDSLVSSAFRAIK